MEGRRFKIVFALLVSSLLGMAASQALASPITLDFDEIDAETGSVSDQGYAGFQWDSRWALGDDDVAGYKNSASSGSQFLSNGGKNVSDLSVAHNDPFDFLGASIGTTSKSSDQTWYVEIAAFGKTSDQAPIWQTGWLSVSSLSTRQFSFHVENVHKVMFNSRGGIFTLDDFTYQDIEQDIEVKVNEAGGLILLSIGLFGLWAARRRTHP